MEMGYFKTCWNDITNTPNWFGKMLLMALILCIPIFGPIVVFGYLFGWARDISWGVHAPMPKHIFGNEDGKLYSRGFFALVIMLIFRLVPWLLQVVQNILFSVGTVSVFGSTAASNMGGALAFTGIIGVFLSVVIFLISFALTFFEWVAIMRMSVYGRLSAGLQLTQVWKMMRKDFGGLLRIFGMTLLMGLVIGAVLSVLFFIFFMIIAVVLGITVGAGALNSSLNYMDSSVAGLILAGGGITIISLLIFSYMISVIGVFVYTMVVRALGYWTRQFDVPNWRGQEDPLPFELATPMPSQIPPTQPPL